MAQEAVERNVCDPLLFCLRAMMALYIVECRDGEQVPEPEVYRSLLLSQLAQDHYAKLRENIKINDVCTLKIHPIVDRILFRIFHVIEILIGNTI